MGRVSKELDFSEITLDSLLLRSKSDVETVSNAILNQRMVLRANIPSHEAITQVQKIRIEQIEIEKEAKESDLIEHDNFIAKKKKEVEDAQKEFDEAKRKLDEAKKRLSSANNYHGGLQEQVSKCNSILEIEQKNLELMHYIALVHPTASLKKLHEVQVAKFIVTKNDFEFLKSIYPDEVFDPDKAERFVEILPNDLKRKYTENQVQSIIDYCEMAINFKMLAEPEQEILLLFSNEDIAKILKSNGLS